MSSNAFDILRNGFPGPRLAGAAMLLAPLLLIAGATTGIPNETGTTEERQQSLVDAPLLGELTVNFLVGGAIVNVLVIFSLARLVAAKRPVLGQVGGTLAFLGACVSIFFGGIAVFEIAISKIADRAVALSLLESGGPPVVIMLALPGMILGWVVLAIGCYRAGVLPLPRALALGFAGLLPFAVLGGFPLLMPLPFVGLAVAVMPLGVGLLRGRAGGAEGARGEPTRA